MTITTDTLPATWVRAMARARDHKLRCFPLTDGRTFLVSSRSRPGEYHTVTLDEQRAKIAGCTCEGAQHGHGICQHKGRVAVRLLFLRGYSVRKTPENSSNREARTSASLPMAAS